MDTEPTTDMPPAFHFTPLDKLIEDACVVLAGDHYEPVVTLLKTFAGAPSAPRQTVAEQLSEMLVTAAPMLRMIDRHKLVDAARDAACALLSTETGVKLLARVAEANGDGDVHNAAARFGANFATALVDQLDEIDAQRQAADDVDPATPAP